ncbi:MAG: shikimate kinase [Bacteroidota bacterium]
MTGFMGSGKSTIGPILANVLGYDFMDIDRAIELAVGMSVNDIFLESGEDHFRNIERELVASLPNHQRHVISLGGGTILDERNFQTIASSGIVVYLKSSPGNIFKRIYHREDRPVLKDSTGKRLTDEQLRERVERLYLEREPVYAGSDFTIVTDDKKVGITVDEIIRKLSPYITP